MFNIVNQQRKHRWAVEQTERPCCVDNMPVQGHGIDTATEANPAIRPL